MRRLSVFFCGVALLGLLGLMYHPVFGQANQDNQDEQQEKKGKDKKADDKKGKDKKADDKKGKDKKADDKKSEAVKEPVKAAPDCCAPGPSYKHLGCQTLVFVVNGEASSTHTSDNLLDLNGDCRLGLRIQAVNWTRHDAHSKDVADQEAQINAAARLARTVKAIRKDAPNLPIFFVGHSGGAHVVLRTAEMLPEKSIDRIIVLAPAVSSTYDLTRALKTSRGGIDNFYSLEDNLLEHMAAHVGTADGLKCPAAGVVGFRLASSDKKDLEAYKNVRQYRWTQDFCGGGGHYSWTRYHNLKKTVVPMFLAPIPISDTPALAVRKMPPAS
jgi:pimeloyl-ACP methyl ester carboxylesterase